MDKYVGQSLKLCMFETISRNFQSNLTRCCLHECQFRDFLFVCFVLFFFLSKTAIRSDNVRLLIVQCKICEINMQGDSLCILIANIIL